MSPVKARRVAWSLAALALALEVVGVVLYATTAAPDFADVLSIGFAPVFTIVGVLVAARHPRNAIGWIFLGVALSGGLASAGRGFVELRVQGAGDPGALAGAAAVYLEFSFIAGAMVPATFLLLLFPDGRLLSPRWRKVGWCAGIGMLGVLVAGALAEPLDAYPTLRNPFDVGGALVPVLIIPCVLLMYIGIFGSVAALVVRFRHAARVQRQQIKWLATAGAVLAVILPLDTALSSITGGAAFVVSQIALLGLPVAVGIAILRHRLYDIDVVINRTLVYGALTATLAGAYLGAVLLLQLALSPLTANSSLAIAGSTLAVAGLFQPARRRIQAIVDRRFYRRKYDAARTIERFGARLRDEVSLKALSDDLRAVVAETMQPAHVTLWLRTPGAGR